MDEYEDNNCMASSMGGRPGGRPESRENDGGNVRTAVTIASMATARAPPGAVVATTTTTTTIGVENAPSDDDVPPTPPARISAACKDMEASVEESTGNLNGEDGTPRAATEEVGDKVEATAKGTPEFVEGDDAPLPADRMCALVEDSMSNGKDEKNDLATEASDDDNNYVPALTRSRHSEEDADTRMQPSRVPSAPAFTEPRTSRGNRSSRNYPNSRRSGRNRVALPATRPPPPSVLSVSGDTTDSTRRMSIVSMFQVLEARLVEEDPPVPIYDAVPVPVENVPWWKRNQKCIFSGMAITIGAMAAIIGTLLFSLSNNNNKIDQTGDGSVRGGSAGLPTLPSTSSAFDTTMSTPPPANSTLNTTMATLPPNGSVGSNTTLVAVPKVEPTTGPLATPTAPPREPTGSPFLRTREPAPFPLVTAPNEEPTTGPLATPTAPPREPTGSPVLGTREPTTIPLETPTAFPREPTAVEPTDVPTAADAGIYAPDECIHWIGILVSSDADSSGGISELEFFSFLSSIEDPPYVSGYFKVYDGFNNLPWVFRVVHKSLACHCHKLGLGGECCESDDAEIRLLGLNADFMLVDRNNGVAGTAEPYSGEAYTDEVCQQIGYLLTKSIPSPAPTAGAAF